MSESPPIPNRVLIFTAALTLLVIASLWTWAELRATRPSALNRDEAHWQSLPLVDQRRYVEQFKRLRQRADYSEVVQRVRAFSAATSDEQDRVRAIRAALLTVLQSRPAGEQGTLLDLPGSARAVVLCETMRSEFPQLYRSLIVAGPSSGPAQRDPPR